MADPRRSVLVSDTAMIDPSATVRLMAYISMFTAELVAAPSAWCAAVENGSSLDPRVPIVLWMAEAELKMAYDKKTAGRSPEVSRAERTALEKLMVSDQVMFKLAGHDPGRDQAKLPLAEFLSSNELLTRALLLGRHEGNLWAVVALQRQRGQGEFKGRAVKSLVRFGPVIGHSLAAATELERDRIQQEVTAVASLSKRETEVAMMVSQGAQNSEIARELDISTGTVKVHLHRVFEKLGVDSRTKLALLVSQAPTDDFD